MADTITCRLIAPADGPALEALMAASPDAGLIGFTFDYQADLIAISRALEPGRIPVQPAGSA